MSQKKSETANFNEVGIQTEDIHQSLIKSVKTETQTDEINISFKSPNKIKRSKSIDKIERSKHNQFKTLKKNSKSFIDINDTSLLSLNETLPGDQCKHYILSLKYKI